MPDFSSASAETSRRIWTVGALCKAVSDALQVRFNPVAVKGELSGFAQASSGHCYFSIKDAQGQLKCAMFKRAASQLEFVPRDGEAVEVFGKLAIYEARGELQLVVESMRRAGAGTLYEQFLKLKAKLEEEGLFDMRRKRELNPMPRKIGVVTSTNAAALHDVCTALQRRVAHIPVVISPAAVQGAQSPASLVSALKTLYAVPGVDVILLVRGGGSIEDLWGFNDESLARTIVQSPVPVISGVGHETDFTIADFCADVRAPTPTAAAELCALAKEQLIRSLDTQEQLISRLVHQQIDKSQQRIDYLLERLGRPSARLQQEHTELGQLKSRLRASVYSPILLASNLADMSILRLQRSVHDVLKSQQDRLAQAGIRLELLDPALVLKRGYAWLSDESGVPLTAAKQLKVEQEVKAVMGDGHARLKVIARE